MTIIRYCEHIERQREVSVLAAASQCQCMSYSIFCTFCRVNSKFMRHQAPHFSLSYVTIISLEYIWKSISRNYIRYVCVFFNIHLLRRFAAVVPPNFHSSKQKKNDFVFTLIFYSLQLQHITAILFRSFFLKSVAKKNVSRCHWSFDWVAAAYLNTKFKSHFAKRKNAERFWSISESTDEIKNVSVENPFSLFSCS